MKNPEFVKNLTLRMNALAISQTELSERTGLAQSQISSYLSGSYAPSKASVRKLAIALKCEPEDLLGAPEVKVQPLRPVLWELSEIEVELLTMFRSLSFVDKARLITFVDDLRNKK